MNKKAQFFSTELIPVILIFLFLFFLSIIVWWNKTNEFATNLELYDMRLAATNIAELLVTNSGNPLNWTTESYEHFGVSDDYHIINNYKWDELISMSENNYTVMKEVLGIPEYDYMIELYDLNDNNIFTFSNFTSYTLSVVWNENVIINDTMYKLRIGVVG